MSFLRRFVARSFPPRFKRPICPLAVFACLRSSGLGFLQHPFVLAGVLTLAAPVLPVRAQPFTFILAESELPDLNYADVSFADVDRDGDLDVVMTGSAADSPPFVPSSAVFLNRGTVTRALGDGALREIVAFEEQVLGAPLWHGSIAWADFDRDGWPDFVLTGTTAQDPPFEGVTRLYRNQRDGRFELVDVTLTGTYGGSASWADYDGDGDVDLLLTGLTTGGVHRTLLYRAEGGRTFTEVQAGLPDLALGSAAWGDFDGDGDPDVLLSGADESGALATEVYRNDGESGFSSVEAGLNPLAFSSVAWGDFDNDGDLDILLNGGRITEHLLEGTTSIYRNETGRFVEVDAELAGLAYGAAAWADYDGDDLIDILLTGEEVTGGALVARLYLNSGAGAFRHAVELPGAGISSAGVGDFDGDFDLDLIVAGTASDGRPLTNLYRNTLNPARPQPPVPDALAATVAGNAVELSWDVGANSDVPVPGLSYAVRVGTRPGEVDVVSPLADPAEGNRYRWARGEVGSRKSRRILNLPRGQYYWSVQSIDQSFTGSAFAVESTFSIEADRVATDLDEGAGGPPHVSGLQQSYPNPFGESTTVVYDVASPAVVELKVYDLLGKEVCVLWRGEQQAGRHEAVWDGRDGSGRGQVAGVYFVRLRSGAGSWSSKLIRVE